jgi:hypothetical protein
MEYSAIVITGIAKNAVPLLNGLLDFAPDD